MKFTFSILLFFYFGSVHGQQKDDGNFSLDSNMIGKYLNRTSKKLVRYDDDLKGKSLSKLKVVRKVESKIFKQMNAMDSLFAKEVYADVFNKYDAFEKSLESDSAISAVMFGGKVRYLDSLNATLQFLRTIYPESGKIFSEINRLQLQLDKINSRFSHIRKFQEFISQRRAYLRQHTSKFNPKNLLELNKEVYYYSSGIKTYKGLLSNPARIERIAIDAIKGNAEFHQFFINPSISSFLNSNRSSTGNVVPGLQYRMVVQNVVQSKFPKIKGVNSSFLRKYDLSKQKSQAQKMMSSGQDAFNNPIEKPDFKVNSQKGKPFFTRIEYSVSMQFGNVIRNQPTMADIGLNAAYKVNDKSLIGLGSSYRLGLGKGIAHINLSHQGFTLRSFIEWKVYGNFSLYGGMEKLYFPKLSESNINIYNTWQNSGLLGLSKKYRVNAQLKGKIQLMYDFFSSSGVPIRNPIVFRTGLSF
jgi:hypothetical protein